MLSVCPDVRTMDDERGIAIMLSICPDVRTMDDERGSCGAVTIMELERGIVTIIDPERGRPSFPDVRTIEDDRCKVPCPAPMGKIPVPLRTGNGVMEGALVVSTGNGVMEGALVVGTGKGVMDGALVVGIAKPGVLAKFLGPTEFQAWSNCCPMGAGAATGEAAGDILTGEAAGDILGSFGGTPRNPFGKERSWRAFKSAELISPVATEDWSCLIPLDLD
jgi:hypothetical protein